MSKPIALIIEDDLQINRIVSLSLQTDFETESATDGDAAMARLAQITPKLVILDLHMPGATAEEILNYIRSEARLSNVFVILATADARLAEYLEEKADLVMLKPIGVAHLRQIASRLT